MIRVTEITTKEEFYLLKGVWNQLLSNSPQNTVFLSWEWLYTWWETYSSGKHLNVLLLQENDGHFIGIAPLYAEREQTLFARTRALKLIGSEEVCSEYLDVITQNNRAEEVIRALIHYLEDKWVGWDIFYFKDVPADSVINDVITRLREKIDMSCREKMATVNPFIALPDREELFISGLSHNRRSALKRKEKKLEKEHGFSFLSINDVGQLGEAFDTFVALHQKLWRSRGFPGMFKRKDFLEFHRNVARRLFESGWLRIYFLSVKGKPVASLYGFQYAGKFYYYQSGFDPHWKGYGVGKILLNHTILEAIRNKLNEYDFLRGETDYKFDFTDTFRRTIHILAAQNTHKANFYIFTKEMLRWTKNSAKKFFPNNLLSRARKIKDNITLR